MTKEVYQNELITFKDLINQIKFTFQILWKKKWLIIIFAIIGGVIGFLFTRFQLIKYEAKIVFMVKEDDSNSLGGLMSVIGNFGMGGSRSKFNLDKVVALANSDKIISSALLDTVIWNTGKTLLADEIISEFDLRDKWKRKKSDLSQFKTFKDPNNLTLIERNVLKSLIRIVSNPENKGSLLSIKYDKDNTIITISVVTTSEELSYNLSQSIYSHLAQFYIKQSTEKAEKTVKNLENKLSNVSSKLKRKESVLKSTQDATLGLYLEQSKLPEMSYNRDVQVNSILYGEVIKNLESAKFTLENAIPVFQVIDQPYYPLDQHIPNQKLNILIGMVLGIFFASLIFYLIQIIK